MSAKQVWISAVLLIFVLLAITTNGWAITIRHDREEWQYIELAEAFPYGGKVGGLAG